MDYHEHIENNTHESSRKIRDEALATPGQVSRVACAAGPAVPWRSRRLWSLWDMKRFDANSFVYLAAEMKRLATHLESAAENSVRADAVKANDVKVLKGHREQLKEAGLQMSLTQLDRIIWRCESENPVYDKEMSRMVNDLSTRVEDECRQFIILILSVCPKTA